MRSKNMTKIIEKKKKEDLMKMAKMNEDENKVKSKTSVANNAIM